MLSPSSPHSQQLVVPIPIPTCLYHPVVPTLLYLVTTTTLYRRKIRTKTVHFRRSLYKVYIMPLNHICYF